MATTPKWTHPDWSEPDLDRGYIIHKELLDDEVRNMPPNSLAYICHKAEYYAKACEKAGIAVTAEEWLPIGKDRE